jgi:hypothetical protein
LTKKQPTGVADIAIIVADLALLCLTYPTFIKEEIAKFQSKIVNISAQVVEPNNIEADVNDLQWFKRNIQAQPLSNGSCAYLQFLKGVLMLMFV